MYITRDRQISIEMKLQVFNAYVASIFLYYNSEMTKQASVSLMHVLSLWLQAHKPVDQHLMPDRQHYTRHGICYPPQPTTTTKQTLNPLTQGGLSPSHGWMNWRLRLEARSKKARGKKQRIQQIYQIHTSELRLLLFSSGELLDSVCSCSKFFQHGQ